MRIRIVCRTLYTKPMPRLLRDGVTHRPLLTFGSRPGAPLRVICLHLGDLLGLLLLLLTLGLGVEEVLHHEKCVAVNHFRVVAVHVRHEER